MEYTLEKSGDLLILSLKGRLLGAHQTISLTEELEEQIALGFVNTIVDLSELEFINSTGLNFLLTLLTKARKEDGEVVLCNLNKLLETLMVTTKLNSFFQITSDLAGAKAHFKMEPTA